MNMMRGEMKDIKKKNRMKFLGMKSIISEMKNILDEINRRLFTPKLKISEYSDLETNYQK